MNSGLNYNKFNQDTNFSVAVSDGTKSLNLDYRRWLDSLSNHKWLILAVTFLVTALTYGYVTRLTPMYKSSTIIEFQKQEQQILDVNGAIPGVVADREFMKTQLVILRSKALSERVVERMKLHQHQRFSSSTISKKQAKNNATSYLVRGLVVTLIPNTRIARIEFSSSDPVEASEVANALVTNYIDGKVERKYRDSSYATNFLSERLALAKKNLELSERELISYAKKNNIFDLRQGGNNSSLEVNSIITLSDDYSNAQTQRLNLELDYEALKKAPPSINTLENDIVLGLKREKLALTTKYNTELVIFKPEYPEMKLLKQRIDEIDSLIVIEQEENVGTLLAEAKSKYEAALVKEKSLEQRVNGLRGGLQSEKDDRIQYSILEREVATARVQFEGLLQRLKEVTTASEVGDSQVSVIDVATPSSSPFAPRKSLIVLGGFLFSFAGSIGLSFVLSFIDDTIKFPDQVKNRLGLPTLATIPKMLGLKTEIFKELKKPKSELSESFFSARAAIEYSRASGVPKSISVTSTQPSEGKTSSSVSLAFVFAKAGKKVLIIDADMRKPSFVADAEKSIGLSGLLTSDKKIMPNVLETDVENLYLLPSGVIPPNPAELLSNSRINQLIEQAEDAFDLVIVDSPPLLNFTDAPSLAGACEGTVLVVLAEKIRTPAVVRTVSRLNANGANLLGVILMQVDAKSSAYTYGSYYSYGSGAYSYGNEKKDSNNKKRKIHLIEGPLRDVEAEISHTQAEQ